jgi:UDP-2-acetamido-3-amino-2,3-dideoxy-glucuronate N-acetyltransferase
MDIPKIAAVGAGYWGKNIVRNLDQLGALACICDSRPKQLLSFKDAYPNARLVAGYDEVLSDPDISGVAIASPAGLHGEMIRQAIEAGKDVYVEKPLCLSEAEGVQLIDMARERGRALMVGHLLHYHEAVIKLKELVKDGVLGKLHYLFSTRLNFGKFRAEENVLWSFAPHDISVILSLTGEMPAEVSASG